MKKKGLTHQKYSAKALLPRPRPDHFTISKGAEDIDEIFLALGNHCHCHIERMADNEYCIILGSGRGKNYKSTIIFIGHWPKKRPSRGGKLTMNITENGLRGKWHY